jgi:hypothetical protein
MRFHDHFEWDPQKAKTRSGMHKQLKVGKTIRMSAGEGRATTARDLARLRETMRRPVQTDDISELKGTEAPVCCASSGKLPASRLGPVRRAILESLDDHKMTRYELWKKARAHCGTLSRSAVYEYLRGARDIGVQYAEDLMMAAKLKVVGQEQSVRMKERKRPLRGSAAARTGFSSSRAK